MIKNHNNDLSIPYKGPRSVLSEEERTGRRGGGVASCREEANSVTTLGLQAVPPVEQGEP